MAENLKTVIRQATDGYGEPNRQEHRNPIMDTREFEVYLENGETDKIMANQIATNLYSQMYNEVSEIFQFKVIVDYKKDRSDLKIET